MKRARLEYDIAYGCFLFSGLPPLIVGVMLVLPMDPGSTEVFGLLILVPLYAASLAAMVGGILLSTRLWKHWPLDILSGLSLLYFKKLFTEFYTAHTIFIVHCIVVITISGIWF